MDIRDRYTYHGSSRLWFVCACISRLEVDPVGSGWSSKLHPQVTIELLQGIRGDAGCMANARIFVCTGTPIQPHDGSGLDGLNVEFRWAVIPFQIIEHIGLKGVLDSCRAFQAY